jgi:hypothetical protein
VGKVERQICGKLFVALDVGLVQEMFSDNIFRKGWDEERILF